MAGHGARASGSSHTKFTASCRVREWPGNYYTNLSLLRNEPSMKALFLGTLAASQATPIIEFITAEIRTEILGRRGEGE